MPISIFISKKLILNINFIIEWQIIKESLKAEILRITNSYNKNFI